MWFNFVFVISVIFGLSNALLILPSDYSKVNLQLFYGQDASQRVAFYDHNITKLLRHRKFNHQRPTVMYISGWMNSPDSESSVWITKAYLNRGDHNLLHLDWSDYSVGVYSGVQMRMSQIARNFGRTLLKLFDKGLSLEKFHCLGHSFGAHACGIMGRELHRVSNKRLKFVRITGLDPAGPGFFPPDFEKPLNKDDGVFVDSIHSDTFLIGTKYSTGHADFFPNYGMIQPTCPKAPVVTFLDFVNSMCSHNNAVRYWADSLIPKYKHLFPSYSCPSWDDFNAGFCSLNPISYMGINADPNKHGSFFIRLASKHRYDGRNITNWILQRLENHITKLLTLDF